MEYVKRALVALHWIAFVVIAAMPVVVIGIYRIAPELLSDDYRSTVGTLIAPVGWFLLIIALRFIVAGKFKLVPWGA